MDMLTQHSARPCGSMSRTVAIAKRSGMTALALAAALLVPGAAFAHDFYAHDPALGYPSHRVFQPYHPWKDGAIFFPTRQGPVPIHVRIYSTPHEPPYYNVPPYIVLDP